MIHLPLSVGILTLYVGPKKRIEERKFLAQCTSEGEKIGVEVLVFTPQDIDHQRKQVHAHIYRIKQKKWSRSWRPLPTIIYDRCRYQATARFKQWRTFRQNYKHLTYLNHPLANKWRVHQVYTQDAQLNAHIPTTKRFNIENIQTMSERFHSLYLKPINGTGGRGILRIRSRPHGMCVLEGRTRERRIIKKQTEKKSIAFSKIKSWCRHDSYLIQQGIATELQNGRVHDYRIIIQKNERGEWQVTGGAGRIGRSGSITSNLHGGGRAVSMEEMLSQSFNNSKTQSIKRKIYDLSNRLAQTLEKHYGRLCELGLDWAIDHQGHPWLLEVNPKPAREVFRHTGQFHAYRTAIRRPLQFAKWLHAQS